MGVAASEEMLFPQDTIPPPPLDLEYLYRVFSETPSDTPAQGMTSNFSLSSQDAPDSPNSPPQIAAPADPADNGAGDCPIRSMSASPIPAHQAVTFPPLNWRRVPQKIYDYGRKQWDFTPSESISFSMNGRPGVNMGEVLRKRFTGLDGRDELVLQNASSAFSCRLLVRLS